MYLWIDFGETKNNNIPFEALPSTSTALENVELIIVILKNV
jgi:hypothetical protein